MKKLRILSLVFFITFSLLIKTNVVYAFPMPAKLRIGLTYRYKEVTNVPISSKLITVGYSSGNSFFSLANLASNAGFYVASSNGYYAKVPQGYATYEAAKAVSDSYVASGKKSVVGFADSGSFFVYLGEYNQAEATQLATSVSGSVVNPNNKRVLLFDASGVPMFLFDNTLANMQVNDPTSGFVTLNDRKFRGNIEFGRFAGKNITAVNVIDPEEYLYSVVQSEMPNAWHMEALKAQAVAARSYTLTRMGVHREDGYELCDSVHCQSYLGKGNEADRSTEAVVQTKGIVAAYNGEPINAVYCSSSGGVTDNSENVWSNAIPYLRGVQEIAETEHKNWTRSFSLSELTQIAYMNNVTIGNITSVSTVMQSNGRVAQLVLNGTSGKHTLQKEEIRTFFNKSSGGSLLSKYFTIEGSQATGTATYSVATLQNPAPVQNTVPTPAPAQPQASQQKVSVYVNGLGTTEKAVDGLFAMGGNSQMFELNGFTAVNSGSVSVYQANAVVAATPSPSPTPTQTQTPATQPTTNSSTPTQTPAPTILTGNVYQSTGNTVTFIGKGNGHGVGMSQFGAKGMAEAGYTFKQILEYYFTGVTVQ